jgi:hypothetical protein
MGRPKSIISKSELAAVLGLSKGRISQLSKREDFPSRPDGRVDREKAIRWYNDVGLAQQVTKRGPKPRRPAAAKIQSTLVAERVMPAPANPSDEPSRADLENALLKQRIKKECLSNDARECSLVDLGKVNAWVAGMITRAAGILDRIPAELGDRLAQISNPIECQKLLKAELDRARNELAKFPV